jgi:hypothetical protein
MRDDCILFSSNPKCVDFDHWHFEAREKLIVQSEKLNSSEINGQMTHGVAAKLINVYMKALFLPRIDATDETVAFTNAIHPPIDSILLKNLRQNEIGGHTDIWRSAEKIRWSNLGSEEYQKLIDAINQYTHGQLWMIEEHWQGHQ